MTADHTETTTPGSRAALLRIALLICTRDRGDVIASTIRSALACAYPGLTLVIVDQSDDLRTEQAVAAFRADPRLRYTHTSTRGKSQAQNLGLALIGADIVMMTDDDCAVPPNWVDEMLAPFLRYPQVGVVFCNVVAAPHDHSAGFIPDALSPRSFLVPSPARWQTGDRLNLGIGAGMAIRRQVAEAIGGFSPLFGPGAFFRAGEDTDFTLRALLAGYQLYRTNSVAVTHYGFRTYEQGRALTRNDMFGLGGIYGRLLRRGHWFALRLLAAVSWVMILQPALDALAHARPPRVLGRAVWLARGLVAGLCIAPKQEPRVV